MGGHAIWKLSIHEGGWCLGGELHCHDHCASLPARLERLRRLPPNHERKSTAANRKGARDGIQHATQGTWHTQFWQSATGAAGASRPPINFAGCNASYPMSPQSRIFESCNCRRFAIALGHFCFRARSMQTCNQKHVGMLLTVHRRLLWRYYFLNGQHILLVPIRERRAIAPFNSKAKAIERPLLLRIVCNRD